MSNSIVSIEEKKMKSVRVMSCLLLAVYFAMMFSCVAFGDDGISDIGSQVNTGLQSVYGVVKAIALPVGIVAIAICGVKILWGNSKSAEEAKSALIRIVIAMAIIFLAPILVKEVAGWFADKATDSSYWTIG